MTYQPKTGESFVAKARRRRGERAIERQLDHQQKKAGLISPDPSITALQLKKRAYFIRQRLEDYRKPEKGDRVLEVGSGAHGLIFGYDNEVAIGLDPLAVEYQSLFPVWQENANTIAGIGEELPFEDDSFNVVLSDNVVDHAADPVGVINELARVLKPSGILYFSVNTHHPLYQMASTLHGLWNAVGLKFEIGPFGDHTIHFTKNRVKQVFEDLPVEVLWSSPPNKKQPRAEYPARGLESKIKTIFPKNILFEIIAVKPRP